MQQNIKEIDQRIEQLQAIRGRNLERLAKYEDQELELEDKSEFLIF